MKISKKPFAFVIMPFAREFEDIYSYFIASTLSESGFEVKRADDIESQNNILRDIVESIKSADIIVADLTSSNPNVYYELGLAHSSSKPVILLTQDLSEVPFDLKSYRILEYSTHFLNMKKSTEQLASLAKGLYNGSMKYGNPYIDFTEEHKAELIEMSVPKNASINCEEDLGIFDHYADIEEGYSKLSEIIYKITDEMGKITIDTKNFTTEINNSTSSPTSGSASYLRKLSRTHAKKLEGFNKLLSDSNVEYYNIALGTHNSLENIIQSLRINDNNNEDYEKFLATLTVMRDQVSSSQDSYNKLISTMENLPKIERFYNRAKENTVNELIKLVENISLTISSVDRAIGIGNKFGD